MPRFLTSAILLTLGVGAYAGEEPRPLFGPGAPIVATPVPLDPTNPARRRLGSLAFLGGWHLTSTDPGFGGVSALAVEGRRVTMLGDAGGVVAFDLDRAGRATRVQSTNLPAGPGNGWSKSTRDSESFAIHPKTGQIWVGYEKWNQIWRYAPGFARTERWVRPPAMRRWSRGSGAEAMTRLRSGRFLVIAEAAPSALRTGNALLFAGDPTAPGATPIRFGYKRPRGFRVTDVAELPDGRWLVLHRRARPLGVRFALMAGGLTLSDGFDSMLRIVDPRGVAPGAVIDGVDLARFAAPLTVENFEALAITRDRGRTILWIASDDNFAPYQRTLLMTFALDERKPVKR